jgi:hypothetical protein
MMHQICVEVRHVVVERRLWSARTSTVASVPLTVAAALGGPRIQERQGHHVDVVVQLQLLLKLLMLLHHLKLLELLRLGVQSVLLQ